METNIYRVSFGPSRHATPTQPMYWSDIGWRLQFDGVDLPDAYEVYFAHPGDTEAKRSIGGPDGALVLNEYLTSGKELLFWVYVPAGTDAAHTKYTGRIPVNPRPAASEAEPTPEQADVITQTIAALNAAVEQTAEDVEAANLSAQEAAAQADRAETAQEAAEAAQTAAETAERNAALSETAAGESEAAARTYAQNAARSESNAEGYAETARRAAQSADGYATAAAESAFAAAERVEEAQAAKDAILNMNATSTTLPEGSTATVTKTTDQQGAVTLTFGIPRGNTGATGPQGEQGPQGDPGEGVPSGGTTGQMLVKATDTDYDTEWVDPPEGEVTQAEFDALQTYVEDMSPVVTVGPAAIASVDDAAPLKAEEIIVGIEPVQDLHGYEAPWPAGGGVNKLDIATASTAKPAWYTGGWSGTTKNANAGITQERGYTNGGAGGFTVALKPGETYTVSWTYNKSINDSCKLHVASYNGTELTVIVDNVTVTSNTTRFSASFTVPSDSVEVAIRPTSFSTTQSGQTYDLDYIQIELGSTATAWAPYSNICPITGWDEMDITRSGANLLPTYTKSVTQNGITYTANADGSVTVNGTATATNTYYAPESTWKWDGVQDVWISGCPAGGNYMNGYSLRVDPVSSGYSAPDIGEGVRLSGFNSSYNLANVPLRFCIVVRANTVCNNLVFRPMLNFGLSALPYTPYAAINAYSITFPASAGTVYGGTLEWEKDGTVTLTKTMASVDLGTMDWTNGSQMKMFFSIGIRELVSKPADNSIVANIVSSAFTPISYNGLQTSTVGRICISASGSVGIVDGNKYASVNDLKTAVSGVQLVYELATPVTYTLTPTEALTLLRGSNNIWADTGNTTLTYRQDVAILLEKLTSQVAALNTAVANT